MAPFALETSIIYLGIGIKRVIRGYSPPCRVPALCRVDANTPNAIAISQHVIQNGTDPSEVGARHRSFVPASQSLQDVSSKCPAICHYSSPRCWRGFHCLCYTRINRPRRYQWLNRRYIYLRDHPSSYNLTSIMQQLATLPSSD
jgi:hypothetical protein